MNVALLTEDLFKGGAERVVCDLALGLSGRGHRVFVYCLKQAGPPQTSLEAGGVTVRAGHSASRAPLRPWRLGIRRKRGLAPSRSLRTAPKTKFREMPVPFCAGLLASWLRRDRIDVAHVHNSAALLVTLPVTKAFRIPLIQTRHGALLGNPSRYRRLAELLAPLLERLIIVGESLRGHLRPARVARDAVCIPNGIDRPAPQAAESRRRLEELCRRRLTGPVLLSVGTLSAEKDTCGLLEAFARLRRRRPNATLVCVGRERGTAYAARVRETLRRLDLGDSVVLTGQLDDAWRLMAGADVFCLASVTEAMPVAIVEAMSQGVPIVATAVGDVGILPSSAPDAPPMLLRDGHNARLVPPRNPRALAEALSQVLKQPDVARARATRAARDYTRFHTAATMVQRYERIYTAVVNRRTPGARRATQRYAAARPSVLMVGPHPAQIGGMTTVIDTLMHSPLCTTHTLHRYWTTTAPPADTPLPRTAATARAIVRHGRALVQLASTIRQVHADIVHIHTCSFFSFYRSLLDLGVARLLRRRVCLHIHGGRFDEFCSTRGPLGRWLIRSGAEAADAVLVLSRDWEARLRPHLGHSRIVVIPNGVASAPPATRRDRRICRFLYLGALCAAKGLAELIEAAARLRDGGVPFELVLAGPQPTSETRDWAAQVRARDLQEHVRFVGPLRERARDELLADADCLVLPSHSEGLPMVVLEAAAAGLAVIATEVGSLPDLATPDENTSPMPGMKYIAPLVPPRDVDRLARAMERLARDARLRREIGCNMRRRVTNRYNIAHVAERLAATYRRILEDRRHNAGADLSAWLARHIAYPLHESLRGRPTLRAYRLLGHLARRAPADVARYVTHRLRDSLSFAARRLPFYTDRFDAHGVRASADDPQAELRKLAPLGKPDVRTNTTRMLWRAVPGGPLPACTGGTTGDTLHFFVDRVRQAQDLGARLFMQGLFGVRPGDRRVHLWGSPVELKGSSVKRWRDRLINELLLNAFEMSPAQMDAHLRRILRFRPRVLYGYSTAVARLAQHAADRFIPQHFPWLRLAVLTGEEVTLDQRKQVQAVFGCDVAAEYGNREVGLIAHECPAGALHVITPHVLVEVLAGGLPAGFGCRGEIVCTTLNTRAQPLIRYRLGDVGALLAQPCRCGLPFPLLRLEGGKVTGFIALPDGRLCHGAISTHALRAEPGIVEFKTYQRRPDRIEVLLVVDEHFRPESIQRIRACYRQMIGDDVQVDCRLVDNIPPDPSGKRRHVVSDVAPSYFNFDVVDAPTP